MFRLTLYKYRPGHDLGDYLPVKASLSVSAVVKFQSNLDNQSTSRQGDFTAFLTWLLTCPTYYTVYLYDYCFDLHQTVLGAHEFPENILENTFCSGLNDIPVAWDDPVDIGVE